MKILGLNEFVCDLENLQYEDILKRITKLMNNKKNIIQKLNIKKEELKEIANGNAEMAIQLTNR